LAIPKNLVQHYKEYIQKYYTALEEGKQKRLFKTGTVAQRAAPIPLIAPNARVINAKSNSPINSLHVSLSTLPFNTSPDLHRITAKTFADDRKVVQFVEHEKSFRADLEKLFQV
jgi:hypothetical protein